MNTDIFNYDPLSDGMPKMAIGLKRLPENSQKDKLKLFHLDSTFDYFRQAKEENRAKGVQHYYNKKFEVPSSVSLFIMKRLVQEYPINFEYQENQNQASLLNRLTEEKVVIDFDGNLLREESELKLTYVDAFDALAFQVTEDLVILKVLEDGSNCANAIHLFIPNGWSSDGAIGKSFETIHKGVPGFSTMVAHPKRVIEGLVSKSVSLERVGAVGIMGHNTLDMHPRFGSEKNYPDFDPTNPQVWLRFERQTVTGFPNEKLFLFTIRTYLTDLLGELSQTQKLIRILKDENLGTNKYASKFIDRNRNALMTYLEQ